MEKIVHPIIKTELLGIKFGDFEANKNINLNVYPGQIHAIVGENGAGKSTLMKMLYGVYKPTSGKIRVDGIELNMTPTLAINSGIGMVFQDFRLIPAFTVLENILMAMPEKERKASKEEIGNKIREISSRYKITIDPDMLVANMDLGQRQRVEIVKVLMMGKMRVLIFDEPTSVLTQEEAREFIGMLRSLRDDGYAVLLITHKLKEILACSDVITVLRRGEIVASQTKDEGFDQEWLINRIMGGEINIQNNYDAMKKKFDDRLSILKCIGLQIKNDDGLTLLHNADLNLVSGEITGLAGISGKGQRELLDVLFGYRHASAGVISICNEVMTNKSVKDYIKSGVALISEDPKRDNVVPGMKIYEHMALETENVKYKKIGIDWEQMIESIKESKVSEQLKLPEVHRVLGTLSGGNMQRCMIARNVMRKPKVLLASYPSRGLDVGMVEEVHKILVNLRNDGCAILFVSEDLEELLAVSDTIVVMTGTTLSQKYNPKKVSIAEIGELMVGGNG